MSAVFQNFKIVDFLRSRIFWSKNYTERHRHWVMAWFFRIMELLGKNWGKVRALISRLQHFRPIILSSAREPTFLSDPAPILLLMVIVMATIVMSQSISLYHVLGKLDRLSLRPYEGGNNEFWLRQFVDGKSFFCLQYQQMRFYKTTVVFHVIGAIGILIEAMVGLR